PGADGLHQGKNPHVLPQRIGLSANIDSLADKVTTVKRAIVVAPLGGFTLLPHGSSPLCRKEKRTRSRCSPWTVRQPGLVFLPQSKRSDSSGAIASWLDWPVRRHLGC